VEVRGKRVAEREEIYEARGGKISARGEIVER
jgi:hypothetical protein